MIFYDIILIALIINACVLWLTVRVFKVPSRLSELEAAVIGFVFILNAIILSFYTAVSVIQTSQTLSVIQSSYFEKKNPPCFTETYVNNKGWRPAKRPRKF